MLVIWTVFIFMFYNADDQVFIFCNVIFVFQRKVKLFITRYIKISINIWPSICVNVKNVVKQQSSEENNVQNTNFVMKRTLIIFVIFDILHKTNEILTVPGSFWYIFSF